MAFSGKASSSSGACHTCRTRRIKCDETKPACLKCQKTNRICPGYKVGKSLQFKDMTATTIKKFESRIYSDHLSDTFSVTVAESSSSLLPTSDQEDDYDYLSSFGVFSPPGLTPRVLPVSKRGAPVLLPRYLTTPTQEQAMCYFVRTFSSLPDSVATPIHSYGFLSGMLNDHPNSRCLQASLTAAALAAFSTRRSCRRLRLQAQAYYSLALNSVNKAIQTTPGAQGNDTMAAVLALAFYESLTSTDLSGYYHHLQGAATIAKFRGKSMAKDPMGLEFLKFMSLELAKNSMMHTSGIYNHSDVIWNNWIKKPWINKNPGQGRRDSVPIRSRDIKEEARKQAEAASQAVKAGITAGNEDSGGDIIRRFIREARGILGDIAVFDASATDKVKLFVDRSQQLLSAYAAPEAQPDPDTAGITIYRRRAPAYDDRGDPIDPLTYQPPEGKQVFDPLPLFGQIYIFRSPSFAMQMVAAAVASLTVSHLLSRCTARIHPNGQHVESREYRTAAQAAQQAAEQLVGSTPWVIGWRPPEEEQAKAYMSRRSRSLSPDTPDDWEERDEGSISLMLFFLWPIFAAASSEFATPAQRTYLLSVLRFMSRDRGMKQAEALLRVAEGDFNESSMVSLVTTASDSLGNIAGLMY